MVSRAVVLLLALAVFLFAVIARADDNRKLTGSAVATVDAVLKCDGIVVAQVVDANTGNPLDPGHGPEVHFVSVRVKTLQMLRGTDHWPNLVLPIHYIPVNAALQETRPLAGSSYIFFIHSYEFVLRNAYIVLKILPATADNIAQVKKLISN